VTQPRLSVIFWRSAARQIEEASDWWRKHREGSPEALSEDLVRALGIIARQPGIGSPAASQRLKGVRRVLLPRVGYFLFYRVARRRNELQVLAFWHAQRGASPKL
jgi:plasmid stabilization system protein ParE